MMDFDPIGRSAAFADIRQESLFEFRAAVIDDYGLRVDVFECRERFPLKGWVSE